MKYIILTVLFVFTAFLSACRSDPPSEEQLKEFAVQNWLQEYEFEKNKLKNFQRRTALMQQTAAAWNVWQDSTLNVVDKKEIVYVRRMASASIMNNPAFYEKHYSGNQIAAKGKGVENEDLTVIYLSDGAIIKASPKRNPEWLGVTIGEKVLKTGGKHVKSNQIKHYYYLLHVGPIRSRYSEPAEIITASDFYYEAYVDYKPLYSR